MIQPFFALVIAEVGAILILLFRTPLRNPLTVILDKMKQGRGPIISKSVGATLVFIFISIINNLNKIRERSSDSASLSSTDQLLLATQLLQASLLGFALFLGLIIDRIHYYIKELQILKKKLDATEKLDRGN